jgi:peptide-methionine (S)-S-oxide reductase
MRWLIVLGLGLALAACSPSAAQTTHPSHATAIFAGGCFWCVESDFEHLEGVIEAVSGYTGGDRALPTYRDHEGHVEAVRVTYDPARVTYAQLLRSFWRHHDPLDGGGQFCDRGPSYRPAIFVTESQRAVAEASRAEAVQILGRNVATPILPARQFWVAEDYHQDYYERNAIPYRFYRLRCGRDARIDAVWRGR